MHLQGRRPDRLGFTQRVCGVAFSIQMEEKSVTLAEPLLEFAIVQL
jgi:hypothetical protein